MRTECILAAVVGNKNSTRYNLRTEGILAAVVGNKRSTRYNLRTECILAADKAAELAKITKSVRKHF